MYAAHEGALPMREEELLARCRAGDLDAFGQIYARYETAVYRYAYRFLGHKDDADDVKQETFLRAYQAIDRFRSQSSLHTWLLKICANLCRDRLKAWERGRIASLDVDELHSFDRCPNSPHEANDPAAVFERAHTAEVVMCALRSMPAAHRELIVLRDLEGLSNSEVAQIVGGSPASIKVRVFRARQMLKQRVAALLGHQEQ